MSLMVRGGLLAPLLALGALLAMPSARAARACDDPQFQTLLQASAPIEAGAHWLDRRLIQWPGQGGEDGAKTPSVFKLYHSTDGGLRAEPDRAVSGADAVLELDRFDAALPPSLAQRFKFVADGPRLALRDADLARLPGLMKGQLLLVRQTAGGAVLAATALQIAGALDDWYAAAEAVPDLGAMPRPDGTRFKLWAPTARKVSLCRYADDAGPALAERAMRLDPATGVWSLDEPGDLSGQYYRYLVEVFVPGIGLVRNGVSDPYAVSLGADSRRGYLADLAAPRLKPAGWDATPRPQRVRNQTDMVIYELHLRDFSIGDATVAPARRGKYLAFAERNSNGMKHLRALAAAGLTDVHLLPVFDFATVPEAGCTTPKVPIAAPDSEAQQAAVMAEAARDCFNWGYDPWHYGAPEGSYASSAADGARRIVEFRQMVQALHREGLRVGMDVVYNHTAAAGQQEKSLLDRIVPGYYQRLDVAGAVERSTCCANTATEHRMMAKLMIDTAERWAREYKIDSFRFDLMAHQPRAAMQALQRRVDAAAGQRINLIGEGWNFGEVANGARFVQASQLSLNGSGIGTFSDRGRDAARGGSAGDSGEAVLRNKGWLNAERPTAANADLIRVGLAGSVRDFTMQTWQGETRPLAEIAYGDQPAGYVTQPGEVVNYVDNHDNETLFDINVLKLPPSTTREDRARVQLLGAALTAFSQGVAYYHAGIDLLRSKSLDRNSFDSGDWFNRLDWHYRDNGFGSGLPPKEDNGAQYPLLQPLLADAGIKPGPVEIAWMRDAFRDLLRIRASSTLLRLPDAAQIRQRLSFPNSGPAQNPAVVAGVLDGAGLPGAGFARLIYFINASAAAQRLELPDEAHRRYLLHPVHSAAQAADRRVAAEARYEPDSGRFHLPARSAVVFIVAR
jgi:pullulanase/glycogen debranching enzyme